MVKAHACRACTHRVNIGGSSPSRRTIMKKDMFNEDGRLTELDVKVSNSDFECQTGYEVPSRMTWPVGKETKERMSQAIRMNME
jgi:hypothetical protein